MGLFSRSGDEGATVGKEIDVDPPRLVRAYSVNPIGMDKQCQAFGGSACSDPAHYMVTVGLGEVILSSYVCGDHIPEFAGSEDRPMDILEDYREGDDAAQ